MKELTPIKDVAASLGKSTQRLYQLLHLLTENKDYGVMGGLIFIRPSGEKKFRKYFEAHGKKSAGSRV